MKSRKKSKGSTLPVRIARAAADLRPIAQITADAFAGGQHVDEISQQYIGNCHYDWNTSRLIWDGDQLVHHWGVWGYPMRLDGVQLQVAGVGAVVTLEEYRKQGLMQTARLVPSHARKWVRFVHPARAALRQIWLRARLELRHLSP